MGIFLYKKYIAFISLPYIIVIYLNSLTMQQIFEKLNLAETELIKLHATLPHLPIEWRDFLVKALPWLVAFGWVMSALALLSMFNAPFSPLARYYAAYWFFSIGMILMVLSSMVSVAVAYFAFPLLQKMAKLGWTYLFGGLIVSGAIALLTVSGGSIIATLIGLYLLFEVRGQYTK